MRLDQYCAQLMGSRTKSKDAIKSGWVKVNDQIIKKPSFSVSEKDRIVIEKEDPYVSRAAYKLLGAIQDFDIDLTDQVVLDIGASTGGFTQVCLESGAKQVYALDVGHSQLDASLQNDSRVVVMEKKNARVLEKNWFETSIDFICMDVSFISCQTILKQIFQELPVQHMVILIKPQFEVGPEYINKNGLVTSKQRINEVIEDIASYTKEYYYSVSVKPAHLPGRTGNQEYTLYAKERR